MAIRTTPPPAAGFHINMLFAHLKAENITGISERLNGCVGSITASEGTISIVDDLQGRGRVVKADTPEAALHIDVTKAIDTMWITAYAPNATDDITVIMVYRHPTTGNVFTETRRAKGEYGRNVGRNPEDIIGAVVIGAAIYEIDFEEHGA